MRSCYRSVAIPRPRRCGLSAIVVALLMVSAWLPGGAGAAWIDLGGQPLAVDLVSDDGQRSVFEITLGGFAADTIDIEGETYYQITLAGEGRPLEAGLPDLPNVRRALIIPDDREMTVRVLEACGVAELDSLPRFFFACSRRSRAMTGRVALIRFRSRWAF